MENGAGCQPSVINTWLHKEQGWPKHADQNRDLLPLMWSSQKGFLTQVTDSLLSPHQPLLTQHWTLGSWEELLNNPWVLGKHDYKQRQPQIDNNSNQLVTRIILSYWSEELGRAPCLGTLQQRQVVRVCWKGGCWFPSPKLRRTGEDENLSDLVNPDLTICPKNFDSLFWFWWSYGQQQILYSVAFISFESSDCGEVWNRSSWMMGRRWGSRAMQVSALGLMDHLLFLRQVAELLGNVFLCQKERWTQRVMGGTRQKDLHQFCLNSRETVQQHFLPALGMTAQSTAEQGSLGGQAGGSWKHCQE